jgi:hypothetical protein
VRIAVGHARIDTATAGIDGYERAAVAKNAGDVAETIGAAKQAISNSARAIDRVSTDVRVIPGDARIDTAVIGIDAYQRFTAAENIAGVADVTEPGQAAEVANAPETERNVRFRAADVSREASIVQRNVIAAAKIRVQDAIASGSADVISAGHDVDAVASGIGVIAAAKVKIYAGTAETKQAATFRTTGSGRGMVCFRARCGAARVA